MAPPFFFLFSFFGTAQQKRGYQRGAWPPNEAPGHFTMSVVTKRSHNVKRGYQRGAWPPNEALGHQTRQAPVSTGDGSAGGEDGADIQITQKVHQHHKFSMSIPCTHET